MEDPLHDPLSAGGVAHLLVPSESSDALDVAGAGEVALALVATLLQRRTRTSFGVRGARQGEGRESEGSHDEARIFHSRCAASCA